MRFERRLFRHSLRRYFPKSDDNPLESGGTLIHLDA